MHFLLRFYEQRSDPPPPWWWDSAHLNMFSLRPGWVVYTHCLKSFKKPYFAYDSCCRLLGTPVNPEPPRALCHKERVGGTRKIQAMRCTKMKRSRPWGLLWSMPRTPFVCYSYLNVHVCFLFFLCFNLNGNKSGIKENTTHYRVIPDFFLLF